MTKPRLTKVGRHAVVGAWCDNSRYTSKGNSPISPEFSLDAKVRRCSIAR